MVTRIRSFNAMPTNTAVQFQTGDIRLYTHLHLIALLQQLIDLHTNIFEQFGVAIKVFESLTKKSKWCPPTHQVKLATAAVLATTATPFSRWQISNFFLRSISTIATFISLNKFSSKTKA